MALSKKRTGRVAVIVGLLATFLSTSSIASATPAATTKPKPKPAPTTTKPKPAPTTTKPKPAPTTTKPAPTTTVSPISRALSNPWIPVPHRQTARCVNYLFIGFRGSGEQPQGFDSNGNINGSPWNWSESAFLGNVRSPSLKKTPAEDHLGRTLGELYEAVRLRYQRESKTVGFHSVGISDAALIGIGLQYAAVPVPKVNWAGYINSVTLDSMNATLGAGVAIRKYMSLCPSTKVLIAGYSQGSIMARALAFDFGKMYPGQVQGVMLIADPLFTLSDQRFLVAFDKDHQTNGILKSNPVDACNWNVLTKGLCALATTQVPGFASLWVAMLAWKQASPINNITSSTSASDLLSVTPRVAVICDSGDMVCSPIRVQFGIPGLSNILDSDIENWIPGRTLIHTNYGKVSNSSGWWSERVTRWIG